MRPESIISAYDEELLSIPGVGINFLQKLRNILGKIEFKTRHLKILFCQI